MYTKNYVLVKKMCTNSLSVVLPQQTWVENSIHGGVMHYSPIKNVPNAVISKGHDVSLLGNITNTAILLLNNFKEQSLLVFSIRSLFFVLTNVYLFLPQPAKEKLSQNPKIRRHLLGFTEHPTPTSASRVWHPPSCPVVNYRVILIDLGKTWSTAQYHAYLVTLSLYEEMLNFVNYINFHRC